MSAVSSEFQTATLISESAPGEFGTVLFINRKSQDQVFFCG
jgi:hypothetical protein